MDETAIPMGSVFATPLPEEEEQVSDLTDDDKAIAGLLSVPAWQVYERKVRAKLTSLKDSIDTSKLTLEEVGKRYVVISTVCQLVEETLLQVKAQESAVDEEQRRTAK